MTHSPGYHFTITVRPAWERVLAVAERRAQALGYPLDDPKQLFPFYFCAWFTGTNWAHYEGGIRYDCFGGKTIDWQPESVHLLGAGRTSPLIPFRFGVRDGAFAQRRGAGSGASSAHNDLQAMFDCNSFGFGLDARDGRLRQVLARLPAWQTINFVWSVRTRQASLTVWREDEDGIWYQPLPWAPDFSVRADQDVDTCILDHEYLRVGIHVVPMIERA